MFCRQSKEGLLYWKHSNAVGNGRAYDTVHRKILAGEKLMNHKLFAKMFLANIPRYTKNAFCIPMH